MTERTGSTRATSKAPGRVEGLKAELERVKHAADDVKSEIDAVTDDRRGGPATSVDDATTKAAELRRRIERDVATLRARVPEGEVVTEKARTVGAAVGGGVLALATVITLVKRRGARKEHDAAVREQAIALAREMARLELVDVVVDGGGGRLRWLLLGAVAAGAGAGSVAWQRSRESIGVTDVFGAPEDDPLRPSDVVY